jgi:signal transduction histidine kinase/ligand-binding sensor domain-containing protein
MRLISLRTRQTGPFRWHLEYCLARPGERGWQRTRSPILRMLCLLLFSALSSLQAFPLDPNQSLQQLYHSSWTAKDGLPGIVTALAQTKDGYLWVGTTDGLFRFNGLSFDLYQPEAGDFPSRTVIALAATRDGGLWIGYFRGGASFLKNGQVTNYSDRDGFPYGRVRSFAQDLDGNIWAGAVGGLAKLDGQRWKSNHKGWNYPGNSPDTLYVDKQGTLWAGTGQRIVYMLRGEKTFRDTGILVSHVASFTQAPDGSMWFFDDNHATIQPIPSPIPHPSNPSCCAESASSNAQFDRNGTFWAVSEQLGVLRVKSPLAIVGQNMAKENDRVEVYTRKNGLSDTEAETVLEDREGNIWIGTERGLDRFRNRNLTWSPVLPGDDDHVFSLVAGDDGLVFAGTDPGVVVTIPDGKPLGGGPKSAWGAYHDSDGSLLFYPRHALWRWKAGKFTQVMLPKNALSDRVYSLTRDGAGTLWAGVAGSGEFQLRNGLWTFLSILKNHPDWTPTRAFTDDQGRVWLAYPGIVALVDHGSVHTYTAEQGLAVGNVIAFGSNRKQVWAGGEMGLAMLHGDRFLTVKSNSEAGFGLVTGIVATSGDGLWLSATPGIVHIPESEVQTAVQHPEHQVNYEVYDTISDLPEPLFGVGVYILGVIQSSDGLLWFPTRSGVAHLDPRHLFRNPLPPPLAIRSVIADGKSYSAFTVATLPPLTKNLRIDYDALSLSIPERVKFRYQLQGWDKNWQDAGVRREAFYTNLGPGLYRFHVIACNNDGVWNDNGATWTFTIAPAFYQTTWFALLCASAAMGLAWVFYLLRLRKVTAQIHERLEARMEERLRIARELHDTLLQGFQGLLLRFQAVARQIPKREPAHNMMEQVLDRADEVLIEGRQRVRDLRYEAISQMELPETLAEFGQRLARESTATFKLMIVGTRQPLDAIVRDEANQIGREALTNAFRHSQASNIEVQITYDRARAQLRIRDNGLGIDHAFLSDGREGHWGLSGMRERAQSIGAQLSIWSGPRGGTVIDLTIPAKIAYLRNRKGFRMPWIRRNILRER